jgi:hypothetical protein
VSPDVLTVKTVSGATAAQIVYSFRPGSREIEHLGSAHDDAEVELLKAAARQRLSAGQEELVLGLHLLILLPVLQAAETRSSTTSTGTTERPGLVLRLRSQRR